MNENTNSNKDLSRSVIVILVILSVVISILSTWVVLEEVSRVQKTPTIEEKNLAQSSAEVRLQIVDKTPKSASAAGNIVLNIQTEG
ncbi:hypothetical protein GF327_10145 [Candidatus Woesearchaeota archaeon]|nr:hypothetical protein [Candidatus Woesearchaeota archaeon]